MQKQKRGLVAGLLSLINVFSREANFFNYKWLRESAAYKQYSPEAQKIKIEKAAAKREMRRRKLEARGNRL